MWDNDNPRQWQEKYDKIAIFRVHYSIFEIRRCPICKNVIDNQHEEALTEDRNRIVTSFELR